MKTLLLGNHGPNHSILVYRAFFRHAPANLLSRHERDAALMMHPVHRRLVIRIPFHTVMNLTDTENFCQMGGGDFLAINLVPSKRYWVCLTSLNTHVYAWILMKMSLMSWNGFPSAPHLRSSLRYSTAMDSVGTNVPHIYRWNHYATFKGSYPGMM